MKEFQKYFSVLSVRGLDGLIDSLLNSSEYADYFGEETVPYARSLGEEAQECSNWGPQLDLLNYSAPFRKIPQFITLFSDYAKNLPDQHPYGLSNDYLSVQFGAIFPNNRVGLRKKSAPFGKDTRRILIRRGPGIYSQISNPVVRSKLTNLSDLKVFQISSDRIQGSSVSSVIRAAYLRVFGRLVYQEELILLKKGENQLRDSKMSVRDFIRYLVKSTTFKSIYWQPLYICKAIEYIHNRILGRPTYGRQEINKYFDIVYKQGYNMCIDSIIDSAEYTESFGDNIVPYERYVTPRSLSSRFLKTSVIRNSLDLNRDSGRFIKLGRPSDNTSVHSIQQKIYQGVTALRDQNVVFVKIPNSTRQSLEQILRVAYRQIFERDISICNVNSEFISVDRSFLSGEINVKELIVRLGLSYLYGKEFYRPYPNTKVIELGTKHFLGRAPNNQAEIRFYNQILASQGLSAFISILVSTEEYSLVFGNNTVPYRRFPTLPAANFPNTSKLYSLTKKTRDLVVPSFLSTF